MAKKNKTNLADEEREARKRYLLDGVDISEEGEIIVAGELEYENSEHTGASNADDKQASNEKKLHRLRKKGDKHISQSLHW